MKHSPDELVSFEKRLMKDVFRVWSVTNILEWRVAPHVGGLLLNKSC